MKDIETRTSGRQLRLGLVACAALALPVLAEVPSVKMATTTLVTPDEAWDYYDQRGMIRSTTPLTWTAANRPAEIKELARALGAGRYPDADFARHVYQYVRNNIDIDFRFGLSKGARGALVDQTGTAFDQAHLMVELLREGGITSARYEIGTIKLSRANFEDWVGISNARAACQYLANGSIPARVNGQDDCAAIDTSTVLTNNAAAQGGYAVEMGHIWVVANSTYYDPAYKKRTLLTPPSGFSLSSQLGCGSSCGSTVLGHVPSLANWSGTSGAVQYVLNVPASSVNGSLNTYAQALETYIRNYNRQNFTNLQVQDLLGSRVLNVDAADTVGATHPYSAVAEYTIPGDLPDAFRTTLRVQFDNINSTQFVDEFYGRRLALLGPKYNGDSTRNIAFYAGYRLLGSSSRVGATDVDDTLTLEVRHPYAADNGNYAHEVLVQETDMHLCPDYGNTWGSCTITGSVVLWPLTVVHGWGPSTDSSVKFFADIVKRDQAGTTFEDPSDPNHMWLVRWGGSTSPAIGAEHCQAGTESGPTNTPTPDPGCFQIQQQILASRFLSQGSAAMAIVAGVNRIAEQHHHSLGSIISGSTYLGASMSVETMVSATSVTNSASDRRAYFASAAALLSAIEGSMLEQQANGSESVSALEGITRANAKGYRLVNVTPSNVTRVTAPTGGQSAILVNYNAQLIARIQQYVAEGHSLVIPHRNFNSAWLSFNASQERIGYILAFMKGGDGQGEDLLKDALESARVQERAMKGRKMVNVNLADGTFKLTPPADLETGIGAFPASLQFQRTYTGATPDRRCTWIPGASLQGYWGGSPCGGGPPPEQHPGESRAPSGRISSFAPIGGGWTHNFDIAAAVNTDGMISLGGRSALEAVRVLAAAQTLRALNTGTQSHRSHIAGVFTADWWLQSMQDNVVQVTRGPQSSTFARLPSGAFSPDPGSAEVLTQTAGSATRIPDTSYWRRGSMTFRLLDKAGSTLDFNYAFNSYANAFDADNVFKPTTWTFPTGVVLKFDYHAQGMGNCLERVSNNLGRHLEFDPESCDAEWSQGGISWVEDDSGRRVEIRTTHDSAMASAMGMSASKNYSYAYPTDSMIVRLPDNTEIRYEYAPAPTAPIERSPFGLRKWFAASNVDVPFMELEVDSLNRAKSLSIANGTERTNYFLSGINGERFRRGEAAQLLNPGSPGSAAAVTTSYFDEHGSNTLTVDPLNRCSFNRYDSHRRLVREYAEDNYDSSCVLLPLVNGQAAGQSTLYGYDARHNRTSVTRRPKPSSGSPDITVLTTYKEGPTVATCTNAVTCNKQNTITDGRLNVTTFDWHSTHGQLASITSPAVTEGTPYVSYGYTQHAAEDNTQVWLQTSKTERVKQTPAIQNRVTSYTYYPIQQKLALNQAIVDSGGLNLTTTFDYHADGKPRTIDGPRTNALDRTTHYWDKMGRLTAIHREPGRRTRYTYWPDGELRTTRSALVDNPTDSDVTNPFPSDLNPAQWQTSTRSYYSSGDVYQLTDATGAVITHQYDALGRLEYLIEPVDAASTRTTRHVYDLAGQKLEEYRGWGTSAQIRYSKAGYTLTGKVDWVEDAIKSPTPGQLTVGAGSRTDLIYDGYDRLYQTQMPHPTTGLPDASNYEQYGYDANDNNESKRNRSGVTVTMGYDAMNRERSRIVPDNAAVAGNYAYTLTNTYDLRGEKVSATIGTQSSTTTYDTAGRIDYVTDVYGGNSYVVDHTYDPAGNRIGMGWPGGGTLSYTYDDYDEMDLVTSNIPGLSPVQMQLADYTFDRLGRRDFVAFGNGTSTDPYYYPDDALEGLINAVPGRSATSGFIRNQRDQITRISLNLSGANSQWSESVFLWRPELYTTGYVPDKLNRYSSVGGTNYSYDANGNLTSDGTWTFTYDEENKLRTANASGQPAVVYEYDPYNRRRAKTVGSTKTIYLSDGKEEIEERNGATNAVLRRYAYGKGVDERIAMIDSAACGGRCFYLTNHQNSTVALTNQDGSINQTYGYDPYGNPSTAVAAIPTTGNPFRFTGRRLDPETNLYYYRARYYSPGLGRFLQNDPIGTKDDLNLYGYVGNDPLNNIDPLGTESFKDADAARIAYPATDPGHHVVPYGSTVDYKETYRDGSSRMVKMDISPEARKVFSEATTGVKLPTDVHAGDAAHAEYNKAVRKELMDYVDGSEGKITLKNMTAQQAEDFVHKIKNSANPVIRDFNGKIFAYTESVKGKGWFKKFSARRILKVVGSTGLQRLGAYGTPSPELIECEMDKTCREEASNPEDDY